MKRFFLLFFIIFTLIFCSSCSATTYTSSGDVLEVSAEKRFLKLYSDDSFTVLKDSVTGVCYLVYHSSYKGGLCPLYNSDGSLFVIEE